MMTFNEVSASSYGTQWQSINWKAVERQVLKLQMCIAKEIREGKQGKVKALLWILTYWFLGNVIRLSGGLSRMQ